MLGRMSSLLMKSPSTASKKNSLRSVDSRGGGILPLFRAIVTRIATDCTESDPVFYLENPIQGGYLRAFCTSEVNLESVLFLMAVDSFNDELLEDTGKWRPAVSWEQMDVVFGLNKWTAEHAAARVKVEGTAACKDWHKLIFTDDWPSTRLPHGGVASRIQEIWDTYLSATGKYEICTRADVLDRTIFRLKHITVYGLEAFTEICGDPLATIKRDVLPRFRRSSRYDEMKERLRSCETLPVAESFTVRPPRHDPCLNLEMDITPLSALQVPRRSLTAPSFPSRCSLFPLPLPPCCSLSLLSLLPLSP
jgi:hypothetical protein